MCRFVSAVEDGKAKATPALCSETVVLVPYIDGCLGAFSSLEDAYGFCKFYDYAWSDNWYVYDKCRFEMTRGTVHDPYSYVRAYAGMKCKDGERINP